MQLDREAPASIKMREMSLPVSGFLGVVRRGREKQGRRGGEGREEGETRETRGGLRDRDERAGGAEGGGRGE
jgi:hypothetical protein